ncbi:MAG: TonB-dependent receptor [Bacteroides sp.]|nr:TonB-dependent receptor [Bacteroides sp.]
MRSSMLFLMILICHLLPKAAEPIYSLSGAITDLSGTPIPYATISLDKGRFRASGDVSGCFVLNLPAGTHRGKVTATGYRSSDFTVDLRRDTTITLTLKPEAVKLGDVSVYAKTGAGKVRDGEFAVNAIDISKSLNKMVTLTDLVDRTAGVRVRREGGVGSDFDLTINGMSGNSIRYFIDGIPLETKGSGLTLDNLPLNTVERVELYKGVVPASFSSDALGGAVNIVTRRKQRNYLDASYGVASFHTQSGDLTGQYIIPGTALAIRPTFSISHSKNDYIMKGVEVWSEEDDRYIFTDKRRFHDDYFSIFTQLEAGVNDVSWADRFFVGISYNKLNKDIQTGAMQNKVYGEAARHSNSLNLSARYNKRFGAFDTRLSLSHTHDRSETVDTAYRKYSWDGTFLPSSGNEMTNKARTIRVYRRPLTVVSAGTDYTLNPDHIFSLNYMLNRRGNDRSDEIDKYFEPSNDVVTKQILSATYTQSFFGRRWQTSYFVKDYINTLSIKQTDNSTVTGTDRIEGKSTKSYWGAGLGTRYTVTGALALKGSYEHSVRLPLSRELLGNGTTVYPNLTLTPEKSNNYNIGIFGNWYPADESQFSYELNGFLRHVQNYIRATISERDGMMQYVNEPAIDIKGLDFQISYFWDNRLQLSLNGSWNDARDLKQFKTDGNPSATYKNRVPNRPWMFGNAEAYYTFRNVIAQADRLRIGAALQYIHWYYLNWEAYGAASSKARIPTQNITSLSLTYSWKKDRYNISLDCDNLFDRLAYDNYMLQKPGRSFAAKFRLSFY